MCRVRVVCVRALGRYAIFDDIDELCAAPRLPILSGVVHLCSNLAAEADSHIRWGLEVAGHASSLRAAVADLDSCFHFFTSMRKLQHTFEDRDDARADDTHDGSASVRVSRAQSIGRRISASAARVCSAGGC